MPWGVAAAVGGALISSQASKSAAKSQAKSTDKSTEELRRQYDLTRADYQPYMKTGVRALGTLEGELGRMPSAAEVMQDPGYQFGLQQGQQGLDRKQAAMGGRVSGAALKAASEYATNYASTGYNAAYQRRQDRLNRLQALAGLGQTSTAGSAAAGAQSSNAISNLISSQGDARAASQLAQGNIWGNAINQVGAIAQKKWG